MALVFVLTGIVPLVAATAGPVACAKAHIRFDGPQIAFGVAFMAATARLAWQEQTLEPPVEV